MLAAVVSLIVGGIAFAAPASADVKSSAVSPAFVLHNDCRHSDQGFGGDLCVHWDVNLKGSFLAYPLNIPDYRSGAPGGGAWKFGHNDNGKGAGQGVYHNAASADNFATNQDAVVCSGANYGGTCVVVPKNWHVDSLGPVANNNVSQLWP
ncbi:hypothetical protein [Actinocrispum wychmicini]|nr:hypothetical protein [Actinocrispum wychmicini]